MPIWTRVTGQKVIHKMNSGRSGSGLIERQGKRSGRARRGKTGQKRVEAGGLGTGDFIAGEIVVGFPHFLARGLVAFVQLAFRPTNI